MRPCLLLLIAESPDHGYDLLDRIAELGFERDPGGLYRELRSMERRGLLSSEWQHFEAGPARRRYTLTEPGRQRLLAWGPEVEATCGVPERYVQRCRRVRRSQA